MAENLSYKQGLKNDIKSQKIPKQVIKNASRSLFSQLKMQIRLYFKVFGGEKKRKGFKKVMKSESDNKNHKKMKKQRF